MFVKVECEIQGHAILTDMSRLLETLLAELERPRELSSRVVNYITGTYEIDIEALGSFLAERLPDLEDHEADLILSPVFTPKLKDQAVFAELLGSDSIPRDRWPVIVQEVAARPTRAQLVTPDGRAHAVPLPEVAIERYVHRLRLEGTISPSILDTIASISAVSEHPMLKAVARRAIWENTGREQILASYLTNAPSRLMYSLADAVDLLDMVESHKAVSVTDLLAQISDRRNVLKTQISTGSSAKPFFSARIEEMHGGDRDQRSNQSVGMPAKEMELAFLDRLEQVFTS
jgi:hypothetical protein